MQFSTDKGTMLTLIRFFLLNQKQFLIYSDSNEGMDEQGHLTIHISEVKNLGHMVGDTVSDIDWENLKNTIKTIVNSNKNNQPLSIQDIDYNMLDGLDIVGNRALKLMSSYVDLLRVNQPVFEKNIVEDIIKPADNTNINGEQNVSSTDSSNANLTIETPNFENNSVDNLNQPAFQNIDSGTSSVFDNSSSLINEPSVDNQVSSSVIQEDYQKKYEEQLELISQMRTEIEAYKNKIETLKNIINN